MNRAERRRVDREVQHIQKKKGVPLNHYKNEELKKELKKNKPLFIVRFIVGFLKTKFALIFNLLFLVQLINLISGNLTLDNVSSVTVILAFILLYPYSIALAHYTDKLYKKRYENYFKIKEALSKRK